MRPLLKTAAATLLALPGCDLLGLPPPPGSTWGDTGDPGTSPVGPLGFVGAPCDTARDCDYAGAICLTEDDGYPDGACSMPCDDLCPDDDDAPVTFCVDAQDLPWETRDQMDDGACLSRCDFATFPQSGCRQGYGCATTERPDAGPGDQTYACLPEAASELTACHDALIAEGVPFEPALRPSERPAGSSQVCEIADPVWLLGEVEGVALQDVSGNPTPRVLTSCEAGLALAKTAADLKPDGVVAMRHWGSYACRTISGTSTLSQHAFGDAFDLTGFELDDGSVVTLVDHWEHRSHRPSTDEGQLLYEAAHRWHDDRIWNIILTPNYNLAHDDHFHVDLTPGSSSISADDGRYVGPAQYVD